MNCSRLANSWTKQLYCYWAGWLGGLGNRLIVLLSMILITRSLLLGFVAGGRTAGIPPADQPSEFVLVALACFGSAVSYAIFGMPKSRRFMKIIGAFFPSGPEHAKTRRALELAVVALTGGIAGYFLLTPANGSAAISSGAMWYGALYRIAQDEDE